MGRTAPALCARIPVETRRADARVRWMGSDHALLLESIVVVTREVDPFPVDLAVVLADRGSEVLDLAGRGAEPG